MSGPYPMFLTYIPDADNKMSYWYASSVDFGHSACSATGGTASEAIDNLAKVEADHIALLIEKGERLPEPSKPPFEQKWCPVTTNLMGCKLYDVVEQKQKTIDALKKGLAEEKRAVASLQTKLYASETSLY